MKLQDGAALTETFVLMLVMTPIMFGIPMIGKIIDLRQTTVQASRYSAWEGTVTGTAAAPDDIRARFYSDASVSLGGDASAPNVLWGGNRGVESANELPEVESQTLGSYWHAAHAAVVLDEETGAAVPYSSAYATGAAGKVAKPVESLISNILDKSGKVTGGSWIANDHTQGLLRADVRADIKKNGWFKSLSFQDGTVIMHDNWSAGSDAIAADRAQSMVPAGALRNVVGKTLSAFGTFPLFKELKPIDKSFGHVDMTPLPASESSPRVLNDYEE